MSSLTKHIDWVTILLFLALAVFGWLNVYEASYTFDQTSIFDFSYRSGKQLVWLATALLMGGIILLLDSRIFDMSAYILYALLLLVLIATPFLARDIKGSMSWISLGPVSLQPAEFAKCITALALAKYMSRYDYRLRTWRDMLIPGALVLLPLLIIAVWQRETGSALVLTAFILVFYREGMSGIVLLIGIAATALFIIVVRFGIIPALIAIALFSLITLMVKLKPFSRLRNAIHHTPRARYDRNKFTNLHTYKLLTLTALAVMYSLACNIAFDHLPDHQRTRIEVLLGITDDPQGAGYNVKQSLIAVGSGGLFGKGFLRGTQTKMHFVPEQATDFIFCTVGEEWGFLGSSMLLLAYLAFILRLITLAERQRQPFAQIYAYCVVAIFIFHLTVNVGMVLGLFPVIGIPLPFISYGGSSLWGFTILLAILLRLDAARLDKM